MDVRSLGAMGLVIVVAAIIISMGASILTSLQLQQTANSVAANITGQGLAGLVIFGQWIGLISLVIVASIVIGVIVNYMGGMGGV
jgi:hypothetical protein